jgi:hypothetical protein
VTFVGRLLKSGLRTALICRVGFHCEEGGGGGGGGATGGEEAAGAAGGGTIGGGFGGEVVLPSTPRKPPKFCNHVGNGEGWGGGKVEADGGDGGTVGVAGASGGGGEAGIDGAGAGGVAAPIAWCLALIAATMLATNVGFMLCDVMPI